MKDCLVDYIFKTKELIINWPNVQFGLFHICPTTVELIGVNKLDI